VSKALSLKIPEFKRMTSEIESSPPPAPSPKKTARIPITPSGAEAVILGILRNLDHFQDLFAAAFVNHGFYRVFKRHELGLVKTTLRKMSPPAWEFREIAFPGHDHLHAEDLEVTRPEEEYTPTTYLQCQKQDVQLIREIKSEIMEKCQSFVRPEISTALTSEYLRSLQELTMRYGASGPSVRYSAQAKAGKTTSSRRWIGLTAEC
jgi:hypothetical protein